MGALQALRVGQRLSGPGPAGDRRDRRGGGERVPDRLAAALGGADQARSALEPGRLLRPGGADPRPDRSAQDRHAASEPVAVGRPHVRARWAEEGKDPAAAMENRFAVEAWLERTAAARAATVRRQPLPLSGQGQPALPDRPRHQRRGRPAGHQGAASADRLGRGSGLPATAPPADAEGSSSRPWARTLRTRR